MAGRFSRRTVEIDQWTKPPRLTTDDRDHQWQPQLAGTHERGRRPAYAEPDGQRVLHGSRIHPLPRERRAVLPAPVDVLIRPDLQEQVELLREERVVVLEAIAEEGKGVDERAATDHHLGSAARDEVDGRKVLEHAHRVRGAEHGDRAREPDVPGSRRRRTENDGGRGVEKILAMMLPDSERIEADLVGVLDLFDEIAEAVCCADRAAGV